MPFFTEWSCASSFEVILARQWSHFFTWASASRILDFRCIFHSLLRKRSRRTIRLCRFCTLIHIVSETATVSFRTLSVGFPLPTISKNFLFTLFCPLILDHGACFKISISDLKILHSQILLDTSFHLCLQSVIMRSSFFSKNLLQLWKIWNLRRDQENSSRRHLNTWLCCQEEQQSRQRMYYQAKQMLKKSKSEKARKPPNNTFTMVRQRNVQDFVVTDPVERKRHNATWQNYVGEAYQRRNKSWENSKFEALDSHAKRRRTSASTQLTTWFCLSEKRMQTIARRAPGKDPARLQNHPSQSTSKTKKRTPVRRNWRIRLCSRSSNGLEVL